MADAKFTVDYSDIKALHAQLGKTSKEFQGMVRSIDPAINAAETFSRKIDILNSEFKDGQRDSALYRRAFDGIQQQARMAGVELDKFGNFVSLSNKNIRHQQLLVQQAGYQFGDFFTQISMGQNPLMAFTTQMTQLSGFLQGKWVPYFGVALSAVGALGVALMNAGKDAKGLKEDFDDLVDAISAYNDLLEQSVQSQADLNQEFGKFSGYASTAIEALKEIAETRMNEKLDGIANSIYNLESPISNLNSGVREFLGLNDRLSTGPAVRAAAPFIAALRELESAQGAEAQLAALNNVLSLFDQITAAQGELTDEQTAFREGISQAIVELSKQGAEHTKASEAMENAYEWAVEFGMAYKEHLDDLRDGGVAAQAYYDRLQAAQQYMSRASGAYYQSLIEQTKVQTDLTNEIGAAAVEALKLAGVDLETGVDKAAKAAARLAASLGISYQTALAMSDPAIARTPAGRAMQRYGSRAPSSGNVDNNFAGNFDLPDWMTGRTTRSGGGSAKTPAQMLEEYMAKLENEVELKRSQVGLSEEAARVLELENQYKLRGVEVDNERIASIVAMEEETRKLTEAQKAAERQQEFYKDTLMDGMESIVDGSKSVNEAFRDMLRNMLLDIYRQKVMDPIAEAGSNFLMNLLPFAKGGAFNNGVQMFANGGVVSSPTMFGHSGGLGMMGEAGPEAIMPLKRGPDGKLGVAGSQGNVVVNQSFNFSANGDDSVKRIIAQAAPQIAQMTQKQIMDSRRRGGQMKATFS